MELPGSVGRVHSSRSVSGPASSRTASLSPSNSSMSADLASSVKPAAMGILHFAGFNALAYQTLATPPEQEQTPPSPKRGRPLEFCGLSQLAVAPVGPGLLAC